ncbi:hypothetical protein A2Y47_00650 [Candidatus Giovannonibacteria bacterium RIFCSPLOWO2_12_43_8]|uniref:Uncharacterized protein n=1 Tax=Candidatus Giovannonibacteria bacterium RIFCSPLOWO2_12_43_8 TaxID=1798361 RepID=A0A1F5Y4W6_9BACT|nr:MAG: hypothetical protein A2Y47_00650 [Candidatus Giovannonibacteria bacterium RIFCSPLOWO2_12_43_8]
MPPSNFLLHFLSRAGEFGEKIDLFINISSVPYAQNKNHIFFYFKNNSILANSKAKFARITALQAVSPTNRIFLRNEKI